MPKLLISTGTYPPQVGGPAQYAKELAESFRRSGWEVTVKNFKLEYKLPTGIRHILFFLRIIPAVLGSDLIITLDAFSVGFPTVLAARIFGKKVIIRTGGDFLWEWYVERTGEKVLLRNFYSDTRELWNKKERTTFIVTKLTLKLAHKIMFSTEWQRRMFLTAYNLKESKTGIIENYYGPKDTFQAPTGKTFIGFTRPLIWKNLDVLGKAFMEAKLVDGDVTLDLENAPYEEAMNKMRQAYAVILVSLGDISPNMILDAIRLGKPFILTRETGLYEKLRGVGIFVDPLNEKEIKDKILELANPHEYARWRSRVEQFTYTHTWDDIRDEFIAVSENI